MKKRETVPLFTNTEKTVMGVLSVILVIGSLIVSVQPQPSLLGQIPLARDFNPTPVEVKNSIVLKRIDIGNPIGKEIPTLTGNHLAALKSASLQTNEGKTDLKQFLILHKPGEFTGGKLFFGRDNEGRTGHFVKFESHEPVFEYVLSFSPGLKSSVQNDRLPDLVEVILPIFGREYVVIDAEYNVNLKVVRLKLLGPVGTVQFEDSIEDMKFNRGVVINGKRPNAEVRITGQFANNRLSLAEIRYRPTGEGHEGDIYIPPRNGLRNRMKIPESLLSLSFDIVYSGLKSEPAGFVGGEFISFHGKGGGNYELSFTNGLGQSYSIPLVATDPYFKYGDDDQDLVFKEGGNNADFNIDRSDVFVVTSKQDIHGITNVLSYSRVMYEQGEIIFDDLAGGSKTEQFDRTTGRGSLVVAGNAFTFFVSPNEPHPIVIDQNGDGGIDGDEARIVLKSGANLDLGASNVIGGNEIELRITTPSRLFAEPAGDEVIPFVIREKAEGPDIEFPDPGPLTIKRADGEDRGLSRFGVYMVRNPKRIPSQVVFNFPTGAARVGPADGSVLVTFEREKFLKKKKV